MPAGPVGLPGVQGPQDPSGPAWLYQPSAAELASKVKQAALDVSPRTVLDPRVGVRYLRTLTSRLIKLQGGLVLRAIVDTDAAANNQPDADPSNARPTAGAAQPPRGALPRSRGRGPPSPFGLHRPRT